MQRLIQYLLLDGLYRGDWRDVRHRAHSRGIVILFYPKVINSVEDDDPHDMVRRIARTWCDQCEQKERRPNLVRGFL